MANHETYHMLEIPIIVKADTSGVEDLRVDMGNLQETVKVLSVENNIASKDLRDLQNNVDRLTQKCIEAIELKENMGPLHAQRQHTNFVRSQESIPSRNISSMLPCLSPLELNELLEYVTSDSNFTQLKEFVKSLCGDDVKKSIKRVLDNLMDKSVQKQVSWSGIRTQKPYSFEKTYKRIVDAINTAMMERYDKRSYNYDILATKVSTLLRGA